MIENLRFALTVLSAVILCAAAGASAQNYPMRPLRIIVPFPPGGGSDIVSRVVAQRLAESLAQPVVVENRTGASGNIGHALAAKAAPDGYTILLGSSNFVANPGLLKNNPYDALKDFAAVTYAAGSPNTLIVHPTFQAQTFKEFLAITRANPGKFNFASPGTGTTSHLAAALLKVEGGIDMIHVPYAGAPLAALAVLGNHVSIGFIALPPVQPHLKTGALRALAITSLQRFSATPELPTIAESGFPGFESDTPQMFLVPAGTPKAVITRLNAEIVRILRLPEVKERLVGLGFETVASSPEDTSHRIRSDVAKWTRVVKAAGIQVD